MSHDELVARELAGLTSVMLCGVVWCGDGCGCGGCISQLQHLPALEAGTLLWRGGMLGTQSLLILSESEEQQGVTCIYFSV